MIEKILDEMISIGGVGSVVLAYFLYNDLQDRKTWRKAIESFSSQIQDHEKRISIIETKSN
jgi:hypothetical protein